MIKNTRKKNHSHYPFQDNKKFFTEEESGNQ